MTTSLRFGWPALIAGWILSSVPVARGQEKSSFPDFTGKRIYVVGAPDHYQGLTAQIERLEQSSPQTYYVVVTETIKPYPSVARYAESLFDFWRSQAARSSHTLDANRSVIVVVALADQKVGVHVGATLRNQFGLHATTVERELIKPAFLRRAKDGKYPEAISSLLDATNDWIAERDSHTAYVSVKVAAPGAAAGSNKSPKDASNLQTTTQRTRSTSPDISTTSSETAAPSDTSTTTALDSRTVSQRGSSIWTPATFLILGLLAICLAVLAWLWSNHRRARLHLAGQIQEIKSKAVEVMDRLDSLKERLKLMPTSPEFREPMTGETHAIYQTANEKTTKLWDGWLAVMEALDKAEKLAARSGSMFSRQTLEDAQKLMDEQGSFQEIDRQAGEIAASIGQLDQAHQNARKVQKTLTAIRPKFEAGTAALTKLDLPTSPYQEQLDAVATDTAQANSVLVADPVGTQKVLERIQTRAETLLKRIESVAAICVDSRQVKSALETIKRQVATHRNQGLKLVEQGGNPDIPLEQGIEACAATLAALRAGDPDAAAEKLSTARSLLAEAQGTIEKVQKAKSLCERDQPARLRETDRLRAALPQAESYQRDLERDFSRASWQSVARNLDQANALIATFDRQAQEAAAAATLTRQEYLKGASILEELTRQQKIALRLMSGLGEQLNSLIDIRNDCHKLNDETAARERQIELYVRQNDSIVGDLARNSLETAQQARQEIIARSNEPRPDWPALRQRLAELTEELSIAQSQAEEDVKNHEALVSEFNEVRQKASRVYALLASHSEDRVAANEHYRSAANALDRIGVALNQPRGASATLLQQLRDADADLDESERLAREDIRLAAQAQSMISDGAQAIDQARSYAGMGIAADTSSAEYQLVQAQNLLQSQNYEQSIHSAGSAIEAARQVYYAAMQQAVFQQMAIAAEERRRAARMAAPTWDGISFGAAAAASAATAILENASANAAPAESDSSDSATGVGSWSSDVGQGSW
jgi:hypothetical protein